MEKDFRSQCDITRVTNNFVVVGCSLHHASPLTARVFHSSTVDGDSTLVELFPNILLQTMQANTVHYATKISPLDIRVINDYMIAVRTTNRVDVWDSRVTKCLKSIRMPEHTCEQITVVFGILVIWMRKTSTKYDFLKFVCLTPAMEDITEKDVGIKVGISQLSSDNVSNCLACTKLDGKIKLFKITPSDYIQVASGRLALRPARAVPNVMADVEEEPTLDWREIEIHCHFFPYFVAYRSKAVRVFKQNSLLFRHTLREDLLQLILLPPSFEWHIDALLGTRNNITITRLSTRGNVELLKTPIVWEKSGHKYIFVHYIQCSYHMRESQSPPYNDNAGQSKVN